MTRDRVAALSAGVVLAVWGGMMCGANASDLPSTKAPPHPVITALPVSAFEGAYVGGSIGAEWGRSAGQPVTTTGYSDVNAEGESFTAPPGPYGFSDKGRARPAAYVDGGYNWRFGSLVVGLEGDAGFTDSSARLHNAAVAKDPADPEFGYTVTGKLSSTWRSSARVRFGVLPISKVLLYGTAGVVAGGVHGSVTENVPNTITLAGPVGSFQTPVGGSTVNSARWSGTGYGWIIGAGAESAIADNVTLRGEYLFSSLTAGGKTGAGVVVRNADLVDQQLRFGLNYHF